MFHYDLRSSSRLKENSIKVFESSDYDKVVDDSHFVLDSENCRNAVFSNSNGSSVPQYDDSPEQVDDFIVSMRSGKVTPEEVWQKQQELQQTIKDDVAFEQSKKKSKELLKDISKTSEKVAESKDESKE